MKYRDFGKTGLKVSEIGFGTWPIGGHAYGPVNDRDSIEAIKASLDLGINFFDTADIYGWGRSEELLGKTLGRVRKEVIIASKVGYLPSGGQNFSAKYINQAIEASLRRLKTDYIDIYQLHNPPLKVIKQEETIEALRKLKQQGKIRFFGTSIMTEEEALASIQQGIDSIQLLYNAIDTTHEKKSIPLAHQNQIAIIAREPLANGLLSGKYNKDSVFHPDDVRSWGYTRENLLETLRKVDEFHKSCGCPRDELVIYALMFVLKNPAVSVVIPGMKTKQQVEMNCRASQ